VAQITIKARFVTGGVAKLVKSDAVKVRRALECLEPRQTDIIIAGPVAGFAEALPDRDAAARQKVIAVSSPKCNSAA
jgi:hypothetical protein